MLRCALALLFTVVPSIACGQEAPARKSERLLHIVKYGTAKDLGERLQKHFAGDVEAESLTAYPEQVLLLRTTPQTLKEVVQLLERLDRRPQGVILEVVVAEVLPRKNDKPDSSEKDVDERQLEGPSEEVLAKVLALQKQGHLGVVNRYRLAALENQPTTMLLGSYVPYTVGAVVRVGSGVTRSVAYRNVGTSITATVRVEPEKTLATTLSVEHTHPHVMEDGVELGKDENGTPIRATEFIVSTLKSLLSIPSGKAVVAEGVQTTSKTGVARTLVIVSARLLENSGK
jgi:type II secretory pathway component GspD/PulD (secretin)